MSRHKLIPTKSTVRDAIENAANAVDELKEEMEAWRDGLEDKLSHTEKYQAVSDAADALDNADLQSLGETLVSALETACEDSDFLAGCPEHVAGTSCVRCGWDGRPQHRPGWQRVTVFETPVQSPEHMTQAVLLGKINGKSIYAPLYGGVPHLNTVKQFEARVAVIKTRNAEIGNQCDYVPARKSDEPEIRPVPGFAGLDEREVSFTVAQAYKGKSLSRASRLDNALVEARAAIEAVRAAVEPLAVAHAEGEYSDERAADVAEALDEFEQAIEELSGNVEFPGMYG